MKYFCVVSHTHWDREWYMPFEVFKLKLVDLIDRLLGTLDKYPEFIFHLDAQTVVLEDYLDYRPSQKETLKKYISEGRLVVGPWYLQNDFYLTSGEATVRNLLEGRKIANAFGKCGKAGYAPDQFGNISQLPQILKNFGIDNFIFGRGLAEYEVDADENMISKTTPSEFIWEGADGSRLLAVHMAFWYNNAQRFSEDIGISKILLECVEKQFEDVAVTPYLLLMNGVDHLEAQDNLLPILNKLQGEYQIRQYHMEEYIRTIMKYIDDHHIKLKTYKGELRKGGDLSLLKGTLSSRHYLKTANVQAQNMLECKLEPVYSMLQLYGASDATYSLDHFRYMWKNLMKNHPHDSICGCSRDEIHSHMEDNYARLSETMNEMLMRGFREIAEHVLTDEVSKDHYIIIAVNSTEKKQNGVLEAIIDIPAADDFHDFEITDAKGNSIEYDIISKEKAHKDVFSPINLPGVLDVDRYKVYIYAESVNAYSVKCFLVKKADKLKDAIHLIENGQTILENDFIKVMISPNGTVDLFNKETAMLFEDMINIEETADNGDSYIFGKTDDKVIYGSDYSAEIEVLEYNRYIQKIRIKRELAVPECYDFKNRKRSDNTAICAIDLILTVKKGSELLHIDYTLENRAKDHRIRLLFNTGIQTEISTADIPFDIVSHTIHDSYPHTMSKVFPNTSFSLLEDETSGFAVFTEGSHEYEHLSVSQSLAFTIVRSTGSIVRAMDSLEQIGGDQWECPGNQCIRTLKSRFAIKTYTGNYIQAGIPLLSKEFRNEMIPYFTSCDRKKFAGGRTAVQDTRISELFYLPDVNQGLMIPDNTSILEVNGEGIVVTALKKAEDGKGLIFRIVNLSEKTVEAEIKVNGHIYASNMSEENQAYLGEKQIKYSVSSKKIVTFKIMNH